MKLEIYSSKFHMKQEMRQDKNMIQEIHQDDEWETCENQKALPDKNAVHKQRDALTKQQEISRKQTCWYKKSDVRR